MGVCTKMQHAHKNSTSDNQQREDGKLNQSRDRLSSKMTHKDPLPTTTKFCFLWDLGPSVTIYILVEYIVWILFLLSSLNLELECLEKTNLQEFENVLRSDLYYNVIFGTVEGIPHDNARCE